MLAGLTLREKDGTFGRACQSPAFAVMSFAFSAAAAAAVTGFLPPAFFAAFFASCSAWGVAEDEKWVRQPSV